MNENEDILKEKYIEIGKILQGISIEDAIMLLNRCLYAAWYQVYHVPDNE